MTTKMDISEAMELAARIADPDDGCVEEMMEFGADVCGVLRDELARVTAERDELRSIIAGRYVAPTLAEIAKHTGEWLCDGETVALYFSDDNDTKLRVHAASMKASIGETAARVWLSTKNAEGARWIALDGGRPCAWPKAKP